MKPTKNKVFCVDCERTKMLFETEKKADNFIKFNNEEIEAESGYSPQRSYYCLFCGGYHITSKLLPFGLSRKEQIITQSINRIIKEAENKEKQNIQLKDLEMQIKEMEPPQKEKFFSEIIFAQINEIELLKDSINSADKEKLKEFRKNLEMMYILKKEAGFHKKTYIREVDNEKKIEEWRAWVKKNGY